MTDPTESSSRDDSQSTQAGSSDAGAGGTDSGDRIAAAQPASSTSPPGDQPGGGNDLRNDGLRNDQGPGCLPAVLAAAALMGIVGFVFCAFSTWMLFQQRTELAIRTLQGPYIEEIEQSLLDPDTKQEVVREIKSLTADLQRGKYEDWQAAGIMQNLQRLPLLQWGELQAVETFVRESEFEDREEYLRHLSQLKRAVQLQLATAMELDDVLEPVRIEDRSQPRGYRVRRPLTEEAVAEVAHRSRLVAKREAIPNNESFDEIDFAKIVQVAIERGAADSG